MSSLYVIDNKGEIQSEGGGVLHAAMICGNEVQALNWVAGAGRGIVMLHYDLLREVTPEFIGLLREANSEVNVIVIGRELQDEDIIACVLAGANGYQDINALGLYLEKLIRVVSAGEAWISRKVVAKLIALWRAELVD